MAKSLPKVNLHLAEAQSCLTVARALLADHLQHEEDRKKIEELLQRAENKIDSANSVLCNLRSRLGEISDQI